MKRSKLIYLLLGAALVATAALGVFAFMRANAPVSSTPAIPSGGNLTIAAENRTKVIVYGDSISVGDSPAFSSRQLGKRSWVNYLAENGVFFVGGYAQGGYTAGMILAQKQCQSGVSAPVAVAALGTNSVNTGEDFSTGLRDLERLKSECLPEVKAGSFIVTAVGPAAEIPQAKIDSWNTQLKAAAAERGWKYVDPYTGMRTAQNTWEPGMSFDGLHPTEAAAKIYATNIAPSIIEAGK